MQDAKSQLSALVNRVLQGEQITITRAGKSAVDFVPHRASEVRFGLAPVEFACDPEVFDGPDVKVEALGWSTRRS